MITAGSSYACWARPDTVLELGNSWRSNLRLVACLIPFDENAVRLPAGIQLLTKK